MSAQTGGAYLAGLARKPEEKKLMFGHFHRLPDSISPLRLYAFLKEKCGHPNGFMTFVRDDSVDNLIQWDFLLEDETFVIEILGMNFRTELRLWAFVPFPEPNWEDFDADLAAELKRNSEAIGKTIGTFEKWHLFVNPYARLGLVATELEKRLREASKALAVFPDPYDTTRDHEAYQSTVNGLLSNALELMTLSTVLQSIAPVIGEAAVNLLIYLTAHDQIRNDERLLEDTFRRNIDVRIKRLSIDCRGFARPIDASRKEFKEFLRLMNRRNDALHGNIDPKRAVGNPIYFDLRTIPLVETHKPLVRLQYERLTAVSSADAALMDLQIARGFVQFLLTHLVPDLCKDLEIYLDDLHLGFRPSNRRVGAILPRAMVDILPLFKEGDAGTESSPVRNRAVSP